MGARAAGVGGETSTTCSRVTSPVGEETRNDNRPLRSPATWRGCVIHGPDDHVGSAPGDGRCGNNQSLPPSPVSGYLESLQGLAPACVGNEGTARLLVMMKLGKPGAGSGSARTGPRLLGGETVQAQVSRMSRSGVRKDRKVRSTE